MGARKLMRMGFGSSESVGRTSLRHPADGQVEVEAAAAGKQ